MPDTVILYELSCSHVMPNRAYATETYCYICRKVKRVIQVHVYEWHVKCTNCSVGRWFGLSRDNANRFANRHASLKPNHHLILEYSKHPVAFEVQQKMARNKLLGTADNDTSV